MTTIEHVTAELERQGVTVDHITHKIIKVALETADGRDTARQVAKEVRAAMRPENTSTSPPAIYYRVIRQMEA